MDTTYVVREARVSRQYVTALVIIVTLLPALLATASAPLRAQQGLSVSEEWVLNTGSGIPYSIDLSADGSTAVVAIEYPAKLLVVDVTAGKIVKEVGIFSKDYYASFAAITPDGTKAAILLSRPVSKDNYVFRVALVSVSTGKTLWMSSEYLGYGWNVDFSDDGKLVVVSPGSDNTIYAFRTSNGAVAWKTELSGVAKTLGVRAGGGRVFVSTVTSKGEGTVVILSNDGDEVSRIKNLPGKPILSTLSPDGKLLTIPIGLTESESSFKGWVALYDTATLKRLWLSPDLGEYPWVAAFLPSQQVVATVLDNGKVCFLSISDGSVLKCETHKGWAGDSLASIPSLGLVIVTMDKKVSSDEYVGKVIAYRVSLAGGGQPSTTAPQTTTKPSTTQPTTPKTTPITTQAGTGAATGDVTTPATTTKPGKGVPWTLVAGGGVGAAVAVILALIFLKLRSRQKPAYMPPPPPPPA